MSDGALDYLLAGLFALLALIVWWLFVPRRRTGAAALARTLKLKADREAARRRARAGKLDV